MGSETYKAVPQEKRYEGGSQEVVIVLPESMHHFSLEGKAWFVLRASVLGKEWLTVAVLREDRA